MTRRRPDPAARRRRSSTGRASARRRRLARGVTLTPRELSDLDMLASGALSPLTGFMGREDYERVVEDMRLANGLPWALPVCLAVDGGAEGRPRRARRRGGARSPCSTSRRSTTTTRSARPSGASGRPTASTPASPGSTSRSRPLPRPAGDGLRAAAAGLPGARRDPRETRALFAERGWRRVVGFQTRNPIHRAHEYLTKCALETVDGLLIHPLVGETKSDDVPAAFASSATACCSTATTRRPRARLRLPGGDALRRARARRSGTRSAARTTAARTSSSAATTPASAATTAPTTRS